MVDASVLPYVTNANIYAPTMMVAEKAADVIAGNTPLPPARVEYYRHRVHSEQLHGSASTPNIQATAEGHFPGKSEKFLAKDACVTLKATQ